MISLDPSSALAEEPEPSYIYFGGIHLTSMVRMVIVAVQGSVDLLVAGRFFGMHYPCDQLCAVPGTASTATACSNGRPAIGRAVLAAAIQLEHQ